MRWLLSSSAQRPLWLRYSVAVLSVVLATIIQLSLGPVAYQIPFLFYLAAIPVAAWYGGLGAGLLATVLSAITTATLFLPPYGSLNVADPDVQIRLLLFSLVAILINMLSYTRSVAETKALENNQRLQATLASIGDGVLAVDIQGNISFINNVAEHLTGWKQSEAEGLPIHRVFNIVNEDTRVPVENPVDKVLQHGTIAGLANHTLLIAKDGTERPIDDSAAPIRHSRPPSFRGRGGQDAGGVTGAIVVFRDITERRQLEREKASLLNSEQTARVEAEESRDQAQAAQERLKFLAEASDVLSSSLDYQTTIKALAAMAVPTIADWCAVDLLSPDETLERLAVTHVDPKKVEWAYELQRRFPPDPNAPTGPYNVLRTGQPEFVPEITQEMLDAANLDAEQLQILDVLKLTSAITMPLIARGRGLGVLTLVMAESGRKYDSEDLVLAELLARRAAIATDNARLYDEAQNAIKVRDQFLSIASHELRTPLTIMQGYAQLARKRLQQSNLDEKEIRMLDLIVAQTKRLNRMITSLLDLSRIETGQLSLDKAPLDICELAQRIVDEARPLTDGHQLEILSPDYPLVVEGDGLRLEQALLNLIQNAAKYDPGHNPIQVRVEQMDKLVCLSVTDRGIGITEEDQPRLFDRFYRVRRNADGSNSHVPVEGMGIGLYVVKEIVTLHGGQVTVSSKQGEGSTFTIGLPLEPMS